MAARLLNGETVKEMRRALGIPQATFATDVIISAGYLCNIEAGRKQPDAPVVRRIADRLGVSIDAITYPVSTERVGAA